MENRIKNMTEGRPVSLIVAFALPLMVGNVFQQQNTVVGKFLGVNALAALGASTWPNWVILGILQGLTQGFSITMAQAFGAKDVKRLKMAVGNSIVLSAISSVIFMVLGQILIYPFYIPLQTVDMNNADILDSTHIATPNIKHIRITFQHVNCLQRYIKRINLPPFVKNH